MKRGWSLRRKESISERNSDRSSSSGGSSDLLGGIRQKSSVEIPSDLFSSFVSEKIEYNFESKYEEWEQEQDSAHWKIPDDDITIKTIPNTSRLAENPVPKELQNRKSHSVKPYIHECIDFFTADHIQVQRKHVDKIPLRNIAIQKRIEASLVKKEFFIPDSETSLTQSQQIFLDPNEIPKPEGVNIDLVTNCSEGTSSILKERRIPLFHVYADSQKYLPEKPADVLFSPYSLAEAVEFVVEAGDISFDLGNVEPYIGSLALYNFAKKKKISETYYFHCNERTQISMLQNPDILPDFAPAIFKLSHSSPDVFFILRVEKILQGDVDTVSEPYNRSETIKSKDKEKYIQAASAAASRYSYWQPFGWACAPLLNEENQIPDSITFKPIYRTREQDILDTNICGINSDGKSSSKKMKSIPGRVTIRIKQIPKEDVIPGRVSPSLVPVKPISESSYFREIQEFSSSPVLEPYTDYANDMYLYIESANLSGRTGSPSAKDIAIEVKFMDCDENIQAPGLPLIYAPGRNILVASAVTPVIYHNKSPNFYREFKIRLPPVLHSGHHLVFTFYQVNAQFSKTSKNVEPSVPVAYAFWQIFPNERVVSKDVLPIFTDVPQFYLSEDQQAKSIDNRKPLLTIRTKLNSTVYTQDLHMNNVLKRMKQIPCSKIDLALKPIAMLTKVHPVRIIKYFPIIMNYLFKILSTDDKSAAQTFAAIPELLIGIHNSRNNSTLSLLRSYTDNCFAISKANNKGVYLYEVILREWLSYIRTSCLDCEILLKFSSFLFKIIFKSMVLKIHESGELKDPSTRKTRFSKGFYEQFRGLFAVLSWEICQRQKSALTVCKDLSRNMAAFCNDLLAIADRNFVFQTIETFIKEVNGAIEEPDTSLSEFKFEFQRILLENEHFVSLNLPRSFSTRLPKASKLQTYFRKRHFLVSIIVKDISRYLQLEEKSVRIQAMDIIRRAFIGHEYDKELCDDELQNKAVSMYFPLLNVIIDHPITSDTVFEEQRDFLMCFLFLLKHTDKEIIQQWLKRENKEVWQERMMESSEVKSTAMTKATIEDFYSSGGVPKRTTFRQRAAAKAAEAAETKEKTPEAGETRAFKRRTIQRNNTGNPGDIPKISYHESMELNLSNEAMFVLLDVIENYLVSLTIEECTSQIFEKVCLYIITILMNRQSFEFLESFFAFLRFFVEKFGGLLFNDAAFLGELCFHVMKYCNCSKDSTRYEASALLFLLMRKQYLCNPDQFHRITVQITIAVSKLVGRGLSTDTYLKAALSNVQEYARLDKLGGKELQNSIAALSERLFTVLRDNMQISKHASDPEMIADLYSRLANGYMNAPSLRITWIESLADFYTKQKRFAESAMCKLHIAAMISEYLNIVKPSPGRPNGCVAFVSISPNILEETGIRETSVVKENDVPDAGTFTEEKLRGYLISAISDLKAADLFELSASVYKLILPIYETNNQYDLLMNAHSDLHQIFANIVECLSSQRRMLGSYYRVRFYGEAFEELDNTEFIYKEPKITKLVEIKERLETLYSAKLQGELKIIVHSNEVDPKELDPKISYIQITSVQPYFDANELEDRKTDFQQKINIKRFIFVTPFTKTGKARTESVADQYIRKTILTTERHFPYIRLRLRVFDKQLIELDPLSHTIEEVKKQSARILQESSAENSSLKTLQPVLSGSVCLQVQAGPLEYSKVFFLDRAAEFEKEKLSDLRAALTDFLGACRIGIDKHETLCESEHDSAFQASLETGFCDTKKKMDSHWAEYSSSK